MFKSLCMTLVYCPGLTCIQEGWQYHSLVDFRLGVKLDSISLSDICTESSKCHTGFHNSGSDHIINVHCSGKSGSQVGEFINNFQFLSIHSDGWLIVRFFRCWLVYNCCLFCADCEIIVITRLRDLSHGSSLFCIGAGILIHIICIKELI